MRKDLKLHYVAGAAVAAAVSRVAILLSTLPLELTLPLAAVLGVGAAYAVGWAKEYLWDAKGKGVVDALDLRRTWQGGILGAALAVIISLVS
jgi:hypothetical protein